MKFKTVAGRVLPLLYFLAVSLPHHPFSYWLDDVFIKPVGFYSVQHFADIASWGLLAVTAAVLIRVAILHRWHAVRHFVVLILLVVLMYFADLYFIVNNIERIHYPQYAALALLLGLSLRNEMLIFFVTTFAGFVDEFLQYVMDPMKTNYLDFDDIVLNILGAAAGVVLLMGLRKPMPRVAGKDFNREGRQEDAKKAKGFAMSLVNIPWRSCLARTILARGRLVSSTVPQGTTRYETVFGKVFRVSMALSGILIVVAGLLGRIVMLVEQKMDRSVFAVVNGKLSFIMSFERHDQFWIKSYFGKVFHVLSPAEGLGAVALLCVAMWVAVRWLKRRYR